MGRLKQEKRNQVHINIEEQFTKKKAIINGQFKALNIRGQIMNNQTVIFILDRAVVTRLVARKCRERKK